MTAAALRKDVRAAVVARLAAAAIAPVSRMRATPLPSGGLPAICVYTIRHQRQPETVDAAARHDIRVEIEIHARAGATVDDDLDDLCAAVEAAMAGDPDLGGLADQVELSETAIGLTGDGDRVSGLARLSYLVTAYVTT